MKPLIAPVLLALAGLSMPVSAQPPAPDMAAPDVAEPVLTNAPAVATPSTRRAAKSPMLSDHELDTQRGGQSIVITNQTMTAITSGNVLNGDYTAGSVALSDFALSNFNGVGNLLINTGAQVSAQSGMNLTINLGN